MGGSAEKKEGGRKTGEVAGAVCRVLSYQPASQPEAHTRARDWLIGLLILIYRLCNGKTDCLCQVHYSPMSCCCLLIWAFAFEYITKHPFCLATSPQFTLPSLAQILVTKEELKKIKYLRPPGLALLGFKPLSDLKPYHQVGGHWAKPRVLVDTHIYTHAFHLAST